MVLATSVAAAGGAAAIGAYLNGRFHLADDANILWRLKANQKEYEELLNADRLSLWYIFAASFKKYAHDRAIWSRSGCYTFGELHDQSARYAQWLLSQGVRPGDLVAMYLLNSPEFFMVWFATLCIGAAPAFINYNLESKALLHCLDVSATKLIIVDEEVGCQRRINDSREEIVRRGMKIWTLDEELKKRISSSPAIVPGDEYRKGVKPEFPYTLIYTRFLDDKPGIDRWYVPMPLYHGTGCITSSTALLAGIGVAVAPRFSVSGFWPDIHDSGSTWFIYVGETARYLLNAPAHPLERQHNLRGAYGNGLRPDVWQKFQQRFNIPEIAEFFNSSEGMLAFINHAKGPHRSMCVGHHGLILRRLFRDIYIPLKIDHETGDIWRNPDTGFAQRMSYEEGGEIVVAVPNREAFGGYWRDSAATNKKFATDVFRKGDLYYRSGDALRRSNDGHWYFVDRLGDTFRWKSENVSTAEVSECLGHFPGIAEANVYGVLVPNTDGRAGCAAVHLDEKTFPKTHGGEPDFDRLLEYLKQNLPRYAVPVFLRVVKASTHMHNHKQNKVPLRKEGVDPKLVGTEVPEGKEDSFLWLKPGADRYVAFDSKDWVDLQSSQARL